MDFPIHTITDKDAEYPHLLSEIAGRPTTLHYRGTLSLEDEMCVAIVGTRKATREGQALAFSIAESLAQKGFVIVSGLALGIDGGAHEGALAAKGRTIAVLANGLDTVYPKQHERLAEHILEGNGCLISEYVDGTPSLPHQFLERNRIVSGLSIATIVIEAPLRSGSIATAHNAIEQGREVFVLPGNVHHSNYAGSHALIRKGARLVTNVDDILEDLGISHDIEKTKKPFNIESLEDPIEKQIVEALMHERTPVSIDRLCELTTLQPHVLSGKLTLLTFAGIIEDVRGMFSLRS